MKAERLLASRREGKQIFYEIDSADLLKLMKALQKIFCGQ
jgi:hypothetical protein